MANWLVEPVQQSFGFDEEPKKHGVFLLFLEARVRSQRGAAAISLVADTISRGDKKTKPWAKWVSNWLFNEAISTQDTGAPVHSEPVLVNGQVSITQKYGRQGTKATDATKKQDGHWMRLGRLVGQDDATAKAAEGQDFWIADYSPAAGTISAWILGDDGSHHEVWFSTATSADEETSRALHAARPPYQLLASLPPGVVISDVDLTSSEVPWDGPDYGYGSGYSGYGYSGYSGYSDSGYSY
jgi:hypothetical protein